MVQHNVFLFMAVLTTFLSVPAAISLYDEFRPAPFLFLGIAAIFWSGFFWVNRKIED
jgi:hypothetical protein